MPIRLMNQLEMNERKGTRELYWRKAWQKLRQSKLKVIQRSLTEAELRLSRLQRENHVGL